MNMPRGGSDDDASGRLIEAARWLSRLHEDGVATSSGFEAWIDAAPENAAAWAQVSEPWDLIGERAAAPQLLELRRAALADAENADRQRSASRRSRRWWRKGAAYAACACLIAGVLVFWLSTRPDVYQTAAGERRVVTLADGSQITLDSHSEVKVHYTRTSRELALLGGQARFDVAHDVERPFSVMARGHKVVATGTAFNVDLFGSKVLVTLIEGHVVVLNETAPPDVERIIGNAVGREDPSVARTPFLPQVKAEKTAQAGRGVELNAGEQLTVSPNATMSIEEVSVDRATSWQNGELVFDNEPLSSVVARVNRYNQRQIELQDAQTENLKISGVFHAGDLKGFVSTVTSYLPVRAVDGKNGTVQIGQR